jgi:hypothetical protein
MHSDDGVNVYSSEFLQSLQHTYPPINRLMRRRLSHSTFMYPPVKPNMTLIPPTHPTHTTKVPLTTLIAYKKWKKSGRINLKSTYQSIQKKLKKASFIAKKQSFLDGFSKCITPVCFWQTIRRLNGKATKQTVPTLMSSQDEEVQNETDKTELLKNQFCSVFNQITPKNVTSILPQDDPDLPVRTSNIKDLLKYINKLPNRKAMGNDAIAASVIKN